MQFWPKNSYDRKLATAFVTGEGVSYFAAPGALILTEDYMPDQSAVVKKYIAKHIIEPHLSFFETCAKAFEPPTHISEESVKGTKKSPSDRALELSDVLVKFGVSSLAGLISSFAVQKGMEMALKVQTPDSDKWKIRLWDGGVHYGAVLLMSTALSGISDSVKNIFSKTLQGVGMTKKDADNASFSVVYTVIPEIAGTATGYYRLIKGINAPSAGHQL